MGLRGKYLLPDWNVPDAHFIHADVTRVEIAPASCDAVAAFYSKHIPRDEHADLLRRIAGG